MPRSSSVKILMKSHPCNKYEQFMLSYPLNVNCMHADKFFLQITNTTKINVPWRRLFSLSFVLYFDHTLSEYDQKFPLCDEMDQISLVFVIEFYTRRHPKMTS